MKAENGSRGSLYGATNPAFCADDGAASQSQSGRLLDTIDPQPKVAQATVIGIAATPAATAEVLPERAEDERESWDSKLTFLLATIG